MSNVKNEKLCLSLLDCEKESDVETLLKKEGLWDDDSSWKVFGDLENNWGIIGIQKAHAADALVEKLVNSVDAVLMREVLKQKINPESPAAPKNMNYALERFFNVKNGNLSHIDSKQRTKLANNIGVIATGSSKNPNITIFDRGEGQKPSLFKDTFLSLAKSNKLKIPFVQGKYNQGGTGVLRFCGKNGLQLLVSRRYPNLSENSLKDEDWGFTLVRRFNPDDGRKHSMFMYLAPQGNILKFNKETIELSTNSQKKQKIEPLEWGTIIKLFEYNIGPALRTNILFDLNYKIALLLPRIGLPIRFYERRKNYSGHTLETTMAGLSVRLDDDKRGNIEDGFPSFVDFSAHGEKFQASIYVFKEGKSKNYRGNEGIIFSVNGQSHGFIPDSFYSRSKRVQMGYLKKSILMIVNCDNLSGIGVEQLFMNSRDRLSKAEIRYSVERELEKIVKNHQGLKDLRQERRRIAIENKLSDSRPLQEILNDIIKQSPGLEALFLQGTAINNPFKSRLVKEDIKFKGELFPTFFNLGKGQELKQCHENQRFRVQFVTDVVNDYFGRVKSPGIYTLKINGKNIDGNLYNLAIWNGFGNLIVSLPPGIKMGDMLEGKLLVEDVNRALPFVNVFEREVLGPIKPGGGGNGKRKNRSKDGKGIKEIPDNLALPNIKEIYETGWEERGWDKFSCLEMVAAGDGSIDYFINMDNYYLKREQKGENNADEAKLLKAKFMYGNVLLGITLYRGWEKFGENASKNRFEIEDPMNMIAFVSKSIAATLLPMVNVLGDLHLENIE